MNEIHVSKAHVSKAEASRLLDISRQAVTQAVKKGRIEFIPGHGIPIEKVEMWRTIRIKEAHDELVRRQAVPRIVY